MALDKGEQRLIAVTRAALADGSARERRVAAGLTQEQMAGEAGVSRSAVTLWEAGKRSPQGRFALAYGRVLRRWAPPVRARPDGSRGAAWLGSDPSRGVAQQPGPAPPRH